VGKVVGRGHHKQRKTGVHSQDEREEGKGVAESHAFLCRGSEVRYVVK